MLRQSIRAASFGLLALASLACTLFGAEERAPSSVTPEPVAPEPVAVEPAAPGTPPASPAASPSGFDAHAVGTRGLANFQRQGYAYAAVVTGTFGDDTVNVVYADGDNERVPPSELYPDTITEGTRVEARVRSWPRFHPGRVARRIAHAVFIEFDDGDRLWTSVGLVRVPVGQLSRSAAPATHEPTATAPAVGSAVVADYQGVGWYYPAIVAEQRADGRMLVVYADGDSEWREPSSVRADAVQVGARVEAQPRGHASVLTGSVARRVGHAAELRLDDGQKIWVALANVRVR